MQIIVFLIVVYVLYKNLINYESINKRIAKRDADPYNTVKSDKWKRKHGLL